MDIKCHWMWEMPEEVNGICVVLDAFAATTNIAASIIAAPDSIVAMSIS